MNVPQCHCVVSVVVSSLDFEMQMLVVPFHGGLTNAVGLGENIKYPLYHQT